MRRQVRALGLSGARLLSLGLLLAAAGPAPGTTPGPAATPTPPTPGPVQVRFTEPSPPAIVSGEIRITVEAATTADARITEVAIFAGGQLLTILERPPYTVRFDAGASPRVLRAVATDSLGRTGETTLRTRPLVIGQYEEVRLVNVYATVRDRRGRPVLDLTKDDFTLLEDGAPQAISHFNPARVPLTVALLIDASNSMTQGGKIDLARKAAEAFVESADREDRMLVRWFNDALFGPEEATADRRALKGAIAGIAATGGTALYDAVFKTAERLAGIEGRRAIVLLSDGRDQAFEENEPGSLHLFEEALERAHRSEAAIYAVGVGRHLDRELDLARERSLKEILDAFARQTGGRSYYPERAGDLPDVYRQISDDLKHQYALGYSPTNRARDGRWRAISLRVRDAGLEVQARSGYYAPGPAAP